MQTHISRLFRRLIAALLVTIMIAAAITPGRVLAGGNIGARAMLVEYYNMINASQYALAYDQWEAPTQTYADFVAGYSTTTHVTAYFGGFQTRQPYGFDGCVPGVLIGYHADGSAVAYRGHYDLLYHPEMTGIAQWTILEGAFTRMDTIPTDETLIYRNELDSGCIEHGSGIEPPPTLMLNDYLDAVNRGELDAAYARWVNPPQTYTDFVNGWADTTETLMFFGYYQSGTSLYEAGRIPVVMFGYHTDGSRVAYQGCLGLSYIGAALDPWRLYAAYLYPLSLDPTNATIITNALNVACY
ncbi:MAG: hypothetical protein JXA10_19030 [Anaerolineae bacterium]|nr:hypothetical protein [Anaerolineae bacterium]